MEISEEMLNNIEVEYSMLFEEAHDLRLYV